MMSLAARIRRWAIERKGQEGMQIKSRDITNVQSKVVGNPMVLREL